jgi:hypothetical protein
MLAAKRAEFVELQPLGFGLFVLGFAIVLSLALSTLQSNDFAHSFRSLSVARIQESEEVRSRGSRNAAPKRHHLPGLPEFTDS